MNLDYLRRLITTPLNERVADERKALATRTAGLLDFEAYFKEVFAGQIL
ncbi:hypothetical protein [Zoogloea sp.]|nr:hypothetical protein [Zoogloea sp.]MCK6392593.1 hypothetical protein [Zoogloea sp.]